MKKLLTAVAVAATIFSASAASAADRSNGHWEWQQQSNPGPRSALPSLRRVWVSDEAVDATDCAEMRAAHHCSMLEEPEPRIPLIHRHEKH